MSRAVVVLLMVVAALAPAAAAQYDPIPPLNVLHNACRDTTLPRSFGTDYPWPKDPNGFGFSNQTVIGWEGNYFTPLAWLSGSYWARGVPARYESEGRTLCGGMYTFGAYTYGLAAGEAPAPGSVKWTMADGYLPALTTSFTRNGVAIAITNFADRQTIAGGSFELVHTRVRVTNNTGQAVSVPPGASGPGLVDQTERPATVQPGETVDHDYVAAVDDFGSGQALPSPAQLKVEAAGFTAALNRMKDHWNDRLTVAPTLSLPNVALPDTGGLANPGTALSNAFKAAFVYTRIIQAGKAPFSGANTYNWVYNHDAPGILSNRFEQGDFRDARNLLLTARTVQKPFSNNYGANWYWDGVWKTPSVWADYLALTDDTTFVAEFFRDDASAESPWGPSLYKIVHDYYPSELNAAGYLKPTNDNDTVGTWLFDEQTALSGLAAYRYIATRLGETAEAQWADQAYNDLLEATNTALAANQQTNDFDFLPCEIDKPNREHRCRRPQDANWAGSNLWDQNTWDIFLQGGRLDGVLGDPSQTDNLYRMGFSRLETRGVPFPSVGAYPGYSVALNTGYAAAALYGTRYRDLPITTYAWQLASTTGGPNAWWEANHEPPVTSNPWEGSHAAPQFGAIPYAWPLASQTQTLLQSLVASAREATKRSDGTFDYSEVLWIGRGLPEAWVVPGQLVGVNNLTASYDVTTGARASYGAQLWFSRVAGDLTVRLVLSGTLPAATVRLQLPIFASAGVKNVVGGTYDPATDTVTLAQGRSEATITLGAALRPKLTLDVDSTVDGQHPRPTLVSGVATTAAATVTNPGGTELRDVQLALKVPRGWRVRQSTPTTIASVPAGGQATARWSVTPPADANGYAGLVTSVGYDAGFGASSPVSREKEVRLRRPLPLPPNATNLAEIATPTASYTSPWETVSAINNGIYPGSSNDDAETLRWGTWPERGVQTLELTWKETISTDSSSVYFLDDGGGVQLPASWKVQYWNGSAFVDVPNPSGYPVAKDRFNTVTFDRIRTTRLRMQLQSADASVGVYQWVVPSRSLPLPLGSTRNLAPSASATASYTSPWEQVKAVNNGAYPTSSDDEDTPRWGTWPELGQQTLELTWEHPISTDGSSVYFLDDGGGVQVPASWKVQYWTGSAYADVADPSSYPTAKDGFNAVTFDRVTTTRLRLVLQSGGSSVGVYQWVVPGRPLPLPFRASNLAPAATPKASYTSPWEDVEAVNSGAYPASSSDEGNARWGTWPQQGTQTLELEWREPINTDGSSVYFLDDGGGVRVPASWKVQYWNGSAFVDVASPTSYGTAKDAFNTVAFKAVSTTRLRLVLQSGAGSVGVYQWVVPERPVPLPHGSGRNLALSATPSASYTSPWETVSAINSGVFPTSSNDAGAWRWGAWPEQGQQSLELRWRTPVTTAGSSVYFLDDGGGVRVPASWRMQYWNGSAFVDVSNAGTYPVAADRFNAVTFDPVTTTRLRMVMQSGAGSVGVYQWVVPERPLPVPTGYANLAREAIASASYSSPWEDVVAVNEDLYPRSADDGTLRWGTWPREGQQTLVLDWGRPIAATRSAVYFLEDGAGTRLPASWKIQYWNGSSYVDVANPGGYPLAGGAFNEVIFDRVLTSRLRLVLQSGGGAVGVQEWVVPSTG